MSARVLGLIDHKIYDIPYFIQLTFNVDLKKAVRSGSIVFRARSIDRFVEIKEIGPDEVFPKLAILLHGIPK